MSFIFADLPVVIERKEVIVGAICDNCSSILKPTEVQVNGVWSSAVARDALTLQLIGGYGAFFDGRDIVIQVCQECAMRLLMMFPGLAKVFDAALLEGK